MHIQLLKPFPIKPMLKITFMDFVGGGGIISSMVQKYNIYAFIVSSFVIALVLIESLYSFTLHISLLYEKCIYIYFHILLHVSTICLHFVYFIFKIPFLSTLRMISLYFCTFVYGLYIVIIINNKMISCKADYPVILSVASVNFVDILGLFLLRIRSGITKGLYLVFYPCTLTSLWIGFVCWICWKI